MARRQGVTAESVWRPASLYFGWVFLAGFILGTIRTVWVIPRVGTRTAELIEVPIMLMVIAVSARWLDRRFTGILEAGKQVMVGVLALALLLAAEILLGMALRGASAWQTLFDRDPVSGTAYYLALAIFALGPWWFGRRPGRAAGRAE